MRAYGQFWRPNPSPRDQVMYSIDQELRSIESEIQNNTNRINIEFIINEIRNEMNRINMEDLN
jgi:hypothetical protein